MFRSLFHRKPAATPGSLAKTYLDTLGITKQQAGVLRHLTSSQGWPVLLEALDSVISLRAEEMLRIEDSSTLHFYRGRLVGLREVPALVDEILTRLEQLEQADERSRSQHQYQHDPATIATFGTPAWDSTR